MSFNIGDFVSRKSYNNDTCFVIIDINNYNVILKGVNVRLIADSSIDDLVSCDSSDDNVDLDINLDRDDYFYLPGKVLHIDSDSDYLDKCMKFYDKCNVKCKGVKLREEDVSDRILSLVREFNPNILVITGHDAFYKKMGSISDINNYKNSLNFCNSIRTVRREYDYNDLVIVAGGCQSFFEELIKSGANFASSPKRVNIHCLDPCVVACSIALASKNSEIDIKSIIDKTKYSSNGFGGIITFGCCFKGYPR